MNDSEPFFTVASRLDFVSVLNEAIAYAIIISAILAVAFIFWGGISFILSGGQEDKIKSAVNTIRYSIFGLIIVFLSIGIVSLVGRIFDFELLSYINSERIYESIQRIIEKFSETNSSDLNL